MATGQATRHRLENARHEHVLKGPRHRLVEVSAEELPSAGAARQVLLVVTEPREVSEPVQAADELQRATDMPATTLHAMLAEARASGGLPRGCVLVIDEAGMAETRALTPALRLVEEAGGKAVLVGDPAQLPAVAAGGLHAALCERLGATRLLAIDDSAKPASAGARPTPGPRGRGLPGPPSRERPAAPLPPISKGP